VTFCAKCSGLRTERNYKLDTLVQLLALRYVRNTRIISTHLDETASQCARWCSAP